jgi:hypothetical protein
MSNLRRLKPNEQTPYVNHEDLVMYVKLEAKFGNITQAVVENNVFTISKIQSKPKNISDPKSLTNDKFLTTDWTEIYGNVEAGKDYEGFGITSINVKISANTPPQIVINFTDVRGATLFQQGTCSPYSMFFRLPYPVFILTLKGYYGKPVKYYLHLVRFNSKYNPSNGNFESRGEFIGYTYAFLADIPIGLVYFNSKIENTKNDLQKIYKDYGNDLRALNKDIQNYQSLENEHPTLLEFMNKSYALNKLLNSEETNQKTENINDKTASVVTFDSILKELDKIDDKAKKDNKKLVLDYQEDYKNPDKNIILKFITKNPLGLKIYLSDFNNIESLTDQFNNSNNNSNKLDSVYKYINFFDNDGVLIKINQEEKKQAITAIIDNKVTTNINNTPINILFFLTQNVSKIEFYIGAYYKYLTNFQNEYNSELKTESEKLVDDINNGVEEILAYPTTIRNINTIVLANLQSFLNNLLQVSVDAENYYKNNNITNLSKKNNIIFNTNKENQNIGPWTEWYKEDKGNTNSKVEVYPTVIDPNFSELPEVQFVEKFINAVLEARKDTEIALGNFENIAGYNDFIPVNTLETRVAGGLADGLNSNGYEEITNLDQLYTKIAERFYVWHYMSFNPGALSSNGDPLLKLRDSIRDKFIIQSAQRNFGYLFGQIDAANILTSISTNEDIIGTWLEELSNKIEFTKKIKEKIKKVPIDGYILKNAIKDVEINLRLKTIQGGVNPLEIFSFSEFQQQKITLNTGVLVEVNANYKEEIKKLDDTDGEEDYTQTQLITIGGDAQLNTFGSLIGNDPTKKYRARFFSYSSFKRLEEQRSFTQQSPFPNQNPTSIGDIDDIEYFGTTLNKIFLQTNTKNIYNGYSDSNKLSVLLSCFPYLLVTNNKLTLESGSIANSKRILGLPFFNNFSGHFKVPKVYTLFIAVLVKYLKNGYNNPNQALIKTLIEEILSNNTVNPVRSNDLNDGLNTYKTYTVNNTDINSQVLKYIENLPQEVKEVFESNYDAYLGSPDFNKLKNSVIENNLGEDQNRKVKGDLKTNVEEVLLDFDIWVNHMPSIWDGEVIDPIKNFFIDVNKTQDKFIDGFVSTITNNKINIITDRKKQEEKDKQKFLSNALSKGEVDIRLSLYRTFRSLYQKWISSSNSDKLFYNVLGESDDTILKQFKYVTRNYVDIGDVAAVDPLKMIDNIRNNLKLSTYQVIGTFMDENKFLFFSLPSYFALDGTDADNMFKPTVNFSDADVKTIQAFICMFIPGTSKHANKLQSSSNPCLTTVFSDDSLDLNNETHIDEFNNGLNNELGDTISFDVEVGIENQNHFITFDLDQSEFKETAESLAVIDALATKGDVGSVQKGTNIFDAYLTRSYTCNVTALGNAMILPMQYFNLSNIPLFGGSYLIIQVEHDITPHKIITRFKGVRQPRVTIPIVTKFTAAANVTGLNNNSFGSSGSLKPFNRDYLTKTGLEPIKTLIGSLESRNDYNARNLGKDGRLASKFTKDGIITNLTVQEIRNRQNITPINSLDRFFAVGRYQIIPDTLQAAIDKNIVSLNDLFNEETQEKLGNFLLFEARPLLGRYINGKNKGTKKDLEIAIDQLGQEWASFPVVNCCNKDKPKRVVGDAETGSGNSAYYGGTGINPGKSKINIKEVTEALIKTRINQGKEPEFKPGYYNS